MNKLEIDHAQRNKCVKNDYLEKIAMYIVIEGCIGAGKTTVARQLAFERQSVLILEKFTQNPFLKEFYSEPSKYALETELAFVLIHYHELFHDLPEVKDSDCISDFHVAKDLIFARMNLIKADDLQVFMELYKVLTRRLITPDVVVFLRCSDELVMERVNKRNRDIELKAPQQYFIKLNGLYEEYYDELKLPKICVDMDDCDFVKDPSRIKWISERIDNL
ncbi:MAG: deoxynucleoside kinase [Candidatus Hodarchaeota archaeon]